MEPLRLRLKPALFGVWGDFTLVVLQEVVRLPKHQADAAHLHTSATRYDLVALFRAILRQQLSAFYQRDRSFNAPDPSG